MSRTAKAPHDLHRSAADRHFLRTPEHGLSRRELFDAMRARNDRGARYVCLKRRFATYGYDLDALPFPSAYDEFCDQKTEARQKVEERFETLRKQLRIRRARAYRGKGKATILHFVHFELPEPAWGVSVAVERHP